MSNILVIGPGNGDVIDWIGGNFSEPINKLSKSRRPMGMATLQTKGGMAMVQTASGAALIMCAESVTPLSALIVTSGDLDKDELAAIKILDSRAAELKAPSVYVLSTKKVPEFAKLKVTKTFSASGDGFNELVELLKK